MYDIWFCPHYPIEAINSSLKVDRSGRSKVWTALAEDIRERGLLNPIIILNHRPKKFKDHYVMQGLNRLEAIKYLGWSTAPCIVIGDCEFTPKVKVTDIQDYIRDGTVVYNSSHGPHIDGTVPPETYTYPTERGAYTHENYCTIPQ